MTKVKAISVANQYNIDYLQQNIFSLSTGQKKIVSIIAALVSGCELLVLDEPDSNLDKENKDFFFKLLKNKRGPFILFSSHDEATSLDNFLFLDAGQAI